MPWRRANRDPRSAEIVIQIGAVARSGMWTSGGGIVIHEGRSSLWDGGRRKCSECRKWFRPEPTAAGHQKTCCAKCRLERRRRLARKRRLGDLEACREDEKQRQRRHRAAARSKAKGDAAPDERHAPASAGGHAPASAPGHAPASAGGHAPASARNHWNSQPVLAEIVDKVLDLSRATLERELAKNIENFVEKVAHFGGGGPVSPTTLTR